MLSSLWSFLVSSQGVQHLKMLERLILYCNRLPSLEGIKVLFELPVLKELDVRLNPLTENYPDYQAYLVHAMPNLRKLDSCSVKNVERKAAMLQFSSDLPPQQKRSSLNLAEDQSYDIVLNVAATNHGGQRATSSDSLYKESEELKGRRSENVIEQRCSTPKQDSSKSILRSPLKNGKTESNGSKVNEQLQTKSFSPSKVTERPKVSFGPWIDKQKPMHGKQKQKDPPKQTRHAAKGHFTPNPDQGSHRDSAFINIRPPSPLHPGLNLSDPCNPILHPPRLTYSSFNKTEEGTGLRPQAEKKKKGSYRKPLEMLLNLVDKHWRGERSLHHNNNFLSQAVQILSMMESDISSREAEVRTLRQDVDALSFQTAAREEEHKTEVRNLSAQLEEARRDMGKLNEQLRIVLEENVALQKQLIKLERQYLRSVMKSSPITQIREAQTEVDELRKEIEGLRKKVQEAEKVQELSNMLQESHRSLVATNECLLAELKGSGEH
ncbi:centrosomal protein of 72 kDa isoform X1 [Cololabis saira]|uniref:centrosomal protein of 72 kDa isoform X1 n=1 Tax=Cololabis saira TaxID=129043 RepID=UPI002AD49EDF|nr:centrosomal protein of 72 kDa isoform X1 [Cololabis saira]